MRGKLVLLAFLFIACEEDEVPQGLYNYQVERLLSGGAAKTWVLASTNTDGSTTTPALCTDSLRLLITAVATDSINVTTLTPKLNCLTFDSLDLGDANASGDLVFTDSIVFDSGEIWIIDEITARNLTITTNIQTEKWTSL
ncbi:MAG: hypothetical protein ABJG78_15730 [Cyclobacteriaceae bacterium]